jgi:transcriptional regulator with XRE-family HTH domain
VVRVNSFQAMVEERRRGRRLTWERLAETSGVPVSTLRNIVYGPMARPPTQEQLQGLADALGWPLLYLQRKVGEVFGFAVQRGRSPAMDLLVASAAELGPRELRAVQFLIDGLLDRVPSPGEEDADPATVAG